jgi:hypothetical protein
MSNDHSNTPFTSDKYGPVSRDNGVKKNGTVVFLDALGMKKIWQRLGYSEVTKRWHQVTGEFGWMEQRRSDLSLDIRYRALSDTIIITISTENDLIMEDMLNLTFDLLCDPFMESIITKLLLRGTVSYGEFYWSEKLIIGPAVDDAAEYHAKVDWIGVSVSPTILRYIKGSQINNNYLAIYNNIPYKDGNHEGLVLDWPKYDNDRSCFTNLQQEESILLRSNQSRENKKYIRQKYINTYQFYQISTNVNRY